MNLSISFLASSFSFSASAFSFSASSLASPASSAAFASVRLPAPALNGKDESEFIPTMAWLRASMALLAAWSSGARVASQLVQARVARFFQSPSTVRFP